MAKRILVVEDDPDIRESLCDVLNLIGYDTSTASQGREALQVLTENELPNLILLDLMMPIMNGIEFYRQQKADLRIASIPVVIITAAGDAEQRVSNLGTLPYLMKPFNLDALEKTLQELI